MLTLGILLDENIYIELLIVQLTGWQILFVFVQDCFVFWRVEFTQHYHLDLYTVSTSLKERKDVEIPTEGKR